MSLRAHMAFPWHARVGREERGRGRAGERTPPHKASGLSDEGPTFTSSRSLNYLPNTPSPNTATSGGRVSPHAF